MITFFHITIEAHIPSILRQGLLARMSQGAPRNWFCLDDDLDDTASHIYDIYGARHTYWLVTWETDQELLKWRSQYYESPFWFSRQDIPPEELAFSKLGEYLLINRPPWFTFGATRWAQPPPPDLEALLALHRRGVAQQLPKLANRRAAAPVSR